MLNAIPHRVRNMIPRVQGLSSSNEARPMIHETRSVKDTETDISDDPTQKGSYYNKAQGKEIAAIARAKHRSIQDKSVKTMYIGSRVQTTAKSSKSFHSWEAFVCRRRRTKKNKQAGQNRIRGTKRRGEKHGVFGSKSDTYIFLLFIWGGMYTYPPSSYPIPPPPNPERFLIYLGHMCQNTGTADRKKHSPGDFSSL